MSYFGKQHKYCPNCGKHIYDNVLPTKYILVLMCSKECRDEWGLKEIHNILGRDAPEEITVNKNG